MPFTVEREIPVVITVVTVLSQELTTLNGTVEPLLSFLYLIIEHGKHPDFTALQPDKLIRIKHFTIALQASEIAAKLLILRML
ncbi:unknown [Bacteroides sp. CAG:1076]|nr:unknown [Bacteroides sp. CAG:1076]